MNQSDKEDGDLNFVTYKNLPNIYMSRNPINDSDGYFTVRLYNNDHSIGITTQKKGAISIDRIHQINQDHKADSYVNNSLSSLALRSISKHGMKVVSNTTHDSMIHNTLSNNFEITSESQRSTMIPLDVSDETLTVLTKEPARISSNKYLCHVCNKGFARKHNMASHILVHSKEKPHMCSTCSTKFRRIYDLKRHEKLHIGTKPYVCHRCNKCFARIDALTRHKNSPKACSANKPLKSYFVPSSSKNGNNPNSMATIVNRHNGLVLNEGQNNSKLDSELVALSESFTQQFVPITKYRDLVTYTQELQKNLSIMNSRIMVLERIAEGEKGSDQSLVQKIAHKSLDEYS